MSVFPISLTKISRPNTSPTKYLAQRLLGSFEQPLLAAVVKLGPDAYSSALAIFLSENLNRTVTVGQVSRSLNRLKKMGILDSKRCLPEVRQKGQRSRAVYFLTEHGQTFFQSLIDENKETSTRNNPLTSRETPVKTNPA